MHALWVYVFPHLSQDSHDFGEDESESIGEVESEDAEEYDAELSDGTDELLSSEGLSASLDLFREWDRELARNLPFGIDTGNELADGEPEEAGVGMTTALVADPLNEDKAIAEDNKDGVVDDSVELIEFERGRDLYGGMFKR